MILTIAYTRRVLADIAKPGEMETYKTEQGIAVVKPVNAQYWRDACMAALPGFVAGRVLDVETEGAAA